MIHVSKKELGQVEYLIRQSVQGNHVLFDRERLQSAFRRKGESPARESCISDDEAYAVEHHLERLMTIPSLDAKRAYLEGLDAETYEQVVLTYFNIVENSLYENEEARH